MTATPAYAGTVGTEVAQVTTANTNRDGTGTIATVLTAGASGTKIEEIRVIAVGTTTAGVIRLYLHDGSNARLLEEILVTAITPSTTVEVWQAILTYDNLVIPSGWSLRASTHIGETFNVVAFAGDF